MDWLLALAWVGGGVMLLCLLGKYLIAEYFRHKRMLVQDLVKRQKDTEHG